MPTAAEQTAFTPGPWTIYEDDASDGVPFIPITAGRAGSPTYRTVSEVYGNGDDLELTDEDRSRARLIAAAPELYEALQGLVRYAEAVRMSAGMGKSQLARLDAAKAALAKVSG